MGWLLTKLRAWLVAGRMAVVAALLLTALVSSDTLRDGLALIGNAPPATGLQQVTALLGLAPPPGKPVTVIDIDESSWTSWGRPLLMNRAGRAGGDRCSRHVKNSPPSSTVSPPCAPTRS